MIIIHNPKNHDHYFIKTVKVLLLLLWLLLLIIIINK